MHTERQLSDVNVSYVTSLWDTFAITRVTELEIQIKIEVACLYAWHNFE